MISLDSQNEPPRSHGGKYFTVEKLCSTKVKQAAQGHAAAVLQRQWHQIATAIWKQTCQGIRKPQWRQNQRSFYVSGVVPLCCDRQTEQFVPASGKCRCKNPEVLGHSPCLLAGKYLAIQDRRLFPVFYCSLGWNFCSWFKCLFYHITSKIKKSINISNFHHSCFWINKYHFLGGLL